MKFTPTHLAGSYVVELEPFTDERGWFARYFCKNEFEAIGHNKEWLQMNHSFTKEKGTLRGMHFQHPPHSEIKLVRCIAGAVYDVIVDLREGSATFLQYFGLELSAANRRMIYIPEGFAHGFITLADNTELLYHHSRFYTPGAEGGLHYNDPRLGIQWPASPAILSDRDQQHLYIDNRFKGINTEK
jgi:dTDP-4-dehydrorhamnose 3,5-epimerase